METNQLVYSYYQVQRLIGMNRDHLKTERNIDHRRSLTMTIDHLEAEMAGYRADLMARGVYPGYTECWHLMAGAVVTP